MRPLSARDLLGIWEEARHRPPVGRALALLGAALPGMDRAGLASVRLGLRDASLLRLRAASFGTRLEAVQACPECGEKTEFALDAEELLREREGEEHGPRREWGDGRYHVRYRLPDSGDAWAFGQSRGGAAARAAFVDRCVEAAARDGEAMDKAALPEPVLEALEADAQSADPLAEIVLELACPACGKAFTACFDIAAFFWSEIETKARALLREVDALARAYGWGEDQILALSPARRRLYLEMSE
jgi:hypothetical protein